MTNITDEPHTNSVDVDEHSSVQEDRIRSSINSAPIACHASAASELAIDFASATPLHVYMHVSDTVADGSMLKAQYDKSGNDNDSTFKRECRADVFPTPPFTPETQEASDGREIKADNFKSFPWGQALGSGPGVAYKPAIDSVLSEDTRSNIRFRPATMSSDIVRERPHISLQFCSSPGSSSRVMGLFTPEGELEARQPSTSISIDSRPTSLLESYPSSSKQPIRPYVESDNDTDSSSSSPSIGTLPLSTSQPNISFNNSRKEKSSISYQRYVPPPPGTFTSAPSRKLRSEEQARLVALAQQNFASEREQFLRNKFIPVATVVPSSETKANTCNPVSAESSLHATQKPVLKKPRDTSKWSYARQTSYFWRKTKRESFWPYATLGVAELDCFGAGLILETMDTHTSPMEERYPELRFKAQAELAKRNEVSTTADRDQSDVDDNEVKSTVESIPMDA